DPDIELKYVVTSKTKDGMKLEEIEDSISADIDINAECKKYGLLRINIVDLQANKVVWQVSASREMTIRPTSQSAMLKDVEYLFSQFPPK
ncbi:MAG: DUF4136 domain-containing protein, partial [Porticoccus sp.]|nr:DUF4136 domain-containing protein [Porticoccus sp.]